MCRKKQFKYCPSEIDECMRPLMMIIEKGLEYTFLETKSCCCGHGKYPMTILIRDKMSGKIYELMSNKVISRTRNFYKKDKDGYYFIPEVIKN